MSLNLSVAKSPPYMGMGTLGTGKKATIYSRGATLHQQKGHDIWRWGHFALAKSPRDTLHWQKGPHLWAWGHFALAKKAHTWAWGHFVLPKRPHIWGWGHFVLAKTSPYMGMGTRCTGKKARIKVDGDTLHWQKGPNVWAWGHLTLAKRPPYMGMGTLCTSKNALSPSEAVERSSVFHFSSTTCIMMVSMATKWVVPQSKDLFGCSTILPALLNKTSS